MAWVEQDLGPIPFPLIGDTNHELSRAFGVLKEDLFDITAEKPQTIEALKQTPAAAIGSCRYKLKSIEESNTNIFKKN